MGYITPAEFRTKPFGIALRQYDDELLQEYIDIATANVDAFTERKFSQENYTEVFQGDNTDTHLIYEYPIQSLTGITQTTIASTPVTTSMSSMTNVILTDMNLAMGRVELNGLDNNISTFSSGSLYTVTYTGGFAAAPAVVKHATALWVSELLKPDYGGAQESVPEIVPLSSQQISELLIPLRRRRI